MIGRVAARLGRMGFEGPFYVGARGKLRFVAESVVARRELVFAARPQDRPAAPAAGAPTVALHRIRRFEDFAPFAAPVEAEYWPGYLEAWRAPLGWGEEAVVATVDGRPAGVSWLQFGTASGYPTYYGRLLDGEVRVLRVVVLPSWRRRGVNTAMLHRILGEQFAGGRTRAWIECYERNVPSVRTFLRVGFRPVGALSVLEIPGLRGFVRWSSLERSRRLLAAAGVALDAARAAPPATEAAR